jgi:hypothetical protein
MIAGDESNDRKPLLGFRASSQTGHAGQPLLL